MNRDLQILAPWLKEIGAHRRYILPGILLILVTGLSGIALLAISGWFIVGAGITGALLATGVWVYFDIYIAGAAIRVLALTRTVGRYGERLLNHNTVLRLQQQWRVQVFAHMVRQPSRFVSQLRTSDLTQRLTQDLSALDALFLRIKAPSVVATLLLLVVIGAVSLLYQHLFISISILLCYGMALLGGISGARYFSRTNGRLEQYHYGVLREHGQQYFEGLAELSAAGSAQLRQQQLLAAGNALTSAQAERLRRQRMLTSWVALWSGAAVLLLLGMGVLLLIDEQTSVPHIALLVFAALAYGELLQNLPEQNGHWGGVVQAADELNQICTPTGNEPMVNYAPELSAAFIWEHINLTLRGKAIFADLTLTVARGEKVALLAPSGHGKSLLISMMLGLQGWDRGQVVMGQSATHWKSKLGVVEQESRVLAGSIAENLRIVKPDSSNEELWQALAFADLAETVQQMPDQLQTLAGAGGYRLSGGQARRLQLARLYLQDPEFVMLDEPFTGLDEQQQNLLRARLEEWLANRTCFMVAHGEKALPPADAYYTLIQGKAESIETKLS